MLDITSKAVKDTAELELLDADDEPMFDREVRTREDEEAANRCSITLYGPGSKVYEEAENERQNTMMELAGKKGGKIKFSAEQRRQMDATFYARLTKSFNHFNYPAGEDVSGFDLFKAAYLDGSVGFIRAQVAQFLGDWGNFKAGSKTS